MNHHQPTQLALLISLIGVGAVPTLAQASVNDSAARPLDTSALDAAIQPPPCTELEAGALAACGANTDLVWQPPQSATGAPTNVRVLYSTASARHPDWAPGESPGEFARLGQWAPREIVQAAAGSTTDTARDTARTATPRKNAGKTRKLRALAPAPARVNAQPLARLAPVVEQLATLPVPPVAPAAPSAAQSERLFETLIAVLSEAPAAPTAHEADAARPADELAAPPAPRLRAAAPEDIERTPIAVATESNKVLRSLDAILSDARDEVGAIRPAEPTAVVTTQTGKVLAMLGEIATPPAQVEEGPARRLRKLAERAAKAEAKAAAEAAARASAEAAAAAAELAATIAREGVDLMLPLELPTAAGVLEVDVALALEPPALPLDAQFAPRTAAPTPLVAVANAPTPLAAAAAEATRPARKSPFGDQRVAVAEGALDRVRGGFAIEGLNISFGIERAVYVNGALVTTTSLNVSDLGRITAGRGTTAFDVGTIGLVQSGAGNIVAPTMVSAGSIGTVIQNTLDGQKIQNITTINASTNSLGILKGLNLQSSMRGAVIDSLRR